MAYQPSVIEPHWQNQWEKKGLFRATQKKGKKYYVLEMFPYPSGNLHMGHVRNYSIGDAIARFHRMRGFNVLYPMGFDAFGLPAENAAIEQGKDPKKFTEERINTMTRQLKRLGYSYDWERKVITSEEGYYHWNQWFFLQLLKKGLAYKKKSAVNWCKKCNTVLANEQVEDGKCWRHPDTDVQEKELEQWFLKITDYADQLLEDLPELKEWPERVRVMQKNWIGKSEGVDIHFTLEGNGKVMPAYTTRCDTVFSVTFLAIAPEHPMIPDLVKGTGKEQEVAQFIAETRKQTLIDRQNEEKEKQGVFTGKYAVNPVNGEKIPIYVANFALMYGSGIVMCDAHDKRDFRFARKYNIPLKFVISPDGKPIEPREYRDAVTEDGILFDSGKFSGMPNRDALPKIAAWLEKEGMGKRTINYKLRDWLISRQRYWGTPIPVVYCTECGVTPVPEKELPIRLPDPSKADFKGKGNPLATVKEFVETRCPECGKEARRETDTMDTFVDSSWYFLRNCSPGEKKAMFGKKEAEYWMNVDQYIGGIEHAILHLMYARFFYKVLRDLKKVKGKEPFRRLLAQGMVLKDGAKMSKSQGNVVSPDEIVENYGADTTRLFILSAALPEKELEWSQEGVQASFRFLNRLHAFVIEHANRMMDTPIGKRLSLKDKLILSRTHSTIEEVTRQMDAFQFNFAIYGIMNLANEWMHTSPLDAGVRAFTGKQIVTLLAPFAPHLADELAVQLGMSHGISRWPRGDKKKIDREIERSFDMVEKVKEDIQAIRKLSKIAQPKRIVLYLAPAWKWEALKEIQKACEGKPEIGVAMKAVNRKKTLQKKGKALSSYTKFIVSHLSEYQEEGKIEERKVLEALKEDLENEWGCSLQIEDAETAMNDPAGKAKNAAPLKPAIYIE